MTAPATLRLTTAQALVRFLAAQYTERDGQRQRFFAGMLGIFGHGNVAGVGQALLENELAQQESADSGPPAPPALPYILARNEQAMVHTAVGFARQHDRLQTWACTASVGPGSTNMLTGAALATINRIPVLLLPSGTFATRVSAPVLQELESPAAGDVSVNDAFRPLSAYFDQIERPEQLAPALLAAMAVLTDPARTGAVTVSLPQDVQAEAADWPVELFAERTWVVPRQRPDAEQLRRAAELIRGAATPLIVAGGGVHYAGAEAELAALVADSGIPVAETQAGKGSLLHGDPALLGAIGSTGTTAANAVAADADVVIGIGTRYSDFTTASRSVFGNPDVRFVNLNVAAADSVKQAGLAVTGDARESLRELRSGLSGYRVPQQLADRVGSLRREWDDTVQATYQPAADVTDALDAGQLTQGQVLGAVNELSDPRDVVLCAAGSMPGDLHKLWRVRDRKGYHVEYGYSCMGYEIPAAIGVKLADPSRDVFAMVGDGGYLMMPSELVTAVQERVKIIVVLVQNYGFGSIGALSESLGSQRFGTRYRYRDGAADQGGQLDGPLIEIDLAANARSLGATVIEVSDADELAAAIAAAKAAPDGGGPVVIEVRTDPFVGSPDSAAWWDVPVAQVSRLDSTRAAFANYTEHKKHQRDYLAPVSGDHTTPEELS